MGDEDQTSHTDAAAAPTGRSDDRDIWDRFTGRHPREPTVQQRESATHALVIGVSSYPALRVKSAWKMKELDSAASSALGFAEWLNDEYRPPPQAPLRSLRVLLSPTDAEAARLGAARLGSARRANTANAEAALKAFIADCRRAPGGTAILYFAGHGVFRSQTGSSLLLEDLNGGLEYGPDLRASLSFPPVQQGLGHIGISTSWTFVDACQATLRKDAHFGSGGISYFFVEGDRDQREGAYVYSAAAVGTLAYGERGGVSVFLRALLAALRTGAVERDDSGGWVVDSNGLSRHLSRLKDHPKQQFWPRLEGATLTLQTFSDPQGVVKVSVSPADEATNFDVSLVDGGGGAGPPDGPLSPHPLEVSVRPGVWVVRPKGRAGRTCRPELLAPEVRPFRIVPAEFEV